MEGEMSRLEDIIKGFTDTDPEWEAATLPMPEALKVKAKEWPALFMDCDQLAAQATLARDAYSRALARLREHQREMIAMIADLMPEARDRIFKWDPTGGTVTLGVAPKDPGPRPPAWVDDIVREDGNGSHH
jgi:hypothetical protein